MITAQQPPSRSTQYHIINCTSSHQTQGYCQTPTQLSLYNRIVSADIGGMVFFEWLLEDGEIKPDLGDGRLQEEDGNFSDDASQFATKTIDDPKDHYISDMLTDQAMKILTEVYVWCNCRLSTQLIPYENR